MEKKNKPILIFFLCSILFVSNQVLAQDTHYWSTQFGPKGVVLGNTIMGSVNDNSAIYYNPGCLADIDSNSLSISSSVYQYDMVDFIDGAGRNLDLKSGITQVLPSMISGTFNLKSNRKQKFGYALLTKNQTGFNSSARIDGQEDVIPEYNCPGKEEYFSQYSLKSSLSEQWGGVSYGRQLSDRVSIGVSSFLAYRSQSMEVAHIAKVLPPSLSDYSLFITPIISYNDNQFVEMSTIRNVNKIGLSWKLGRVDLGIVATTPSLSLYGSSTTQRDEFYNNINFDNENWTEYSKGALTYEDYIIAADSFRFALNLNTFTLNGRQTSAANAMATRFKSPISLAVGAVFKSRKCDAFNNPVRRLYLSMEYFASIKPYYLILPEDQEVMRPIADKYDFSSIQFLGISESYRSVINFGIGYECKIKPQISILTSWRRNKSYLDYPDYYTEMTISKIFWNVNQYSLGLLYKRKRSEITLGATFCSGSGLATPYAVLTDPSERNDLQGESYETRASSSSFAFTIGYNYFFKCED